MIPDRNIMPRHVRSRWQTAPGHFARARPTSHRRAGIARRIRTVTAL
jgi:hypothetical protein